MTTLSAIRLPALAVLAAATLLQGCATHKPVAACHRQVFGTAPGPALVGQPYGMGMTPIPLNSVMFGSREVEQWFAVESLHAARTPTSNVEVSARLVSCMDTAAFVKMRVSFLRSDTSPAGQPSAWQTVYLEPRAMALYTEKSTSPDAASYLIEVRK